MSKSAKTAGPGAVEGGAVEAGAVIESPCVKLCQIDPGSGLCIGCYRTLEEIAGWARLTPKARRAVMAELPQRAGRIAPRAEG